MPLNRQEGLDHEHLLLSAPMPPRIVDALLDRLAIRPLSSSEVEEKEI